MGWGLFSRYFVIFIPVNPSPGCKSSLDGRGLKRHFTEGATPLPFVREDRVKQISCLCGQTYVALASCTQHNYKICMRMLSMPSWVVCVCSVCASVIPNILTICMLTHSIQCSVCDPYWSQYRSRSWSSFFGSMWIQKQLWIQVF